jgi:hypothetical protein
MAFHFQDQYALFPLKIRYVQLACLILFVQRLPQFYLIWQEVDRILQVPNKNAGRRGVAE